ncbi:MAG: hypothetical protein MJA31_14470, partial [Clostridia bacterium]|nr:hypothetical protein [Clostridia bacterium]
MKKFKQKSFTLIELVLAVMLTVMIVVAASNATRSIINAKHNLTFQDELLNRATFMLDSVCLDLCNIYRDKVDGAYAISLFPLGSTGNFYDRLKFYSVCDPELEGSLAYVNEIEYGLLESGSGGKGYLLGRRVAPVENVSFGNNKGKVFVLLDGVKSLRFEFWDGASWQRSVLSGESF